MLDPRAPVLPADLGERLVREDYRRDFRARDAQIRDGGSWKLERRQHFEEQGSASWDAVRRGEWEEALRLLEERRNGLMRAALEDARRGYVFHRVRVVQKPFTPYMQWQLNSLRMRAECGEKINVVEAAEVSGAEQSGILPEMVILDGSTLYRVLYNATGVPDGAIRFTDSGTVKRWEDFVKELHRSGEDVRSYFDREVAHLPPPGRPARVRTV